MHLSDLHLGKRVNGFSMLEDQAYILEQILEIVKTERPDGVLLAGDIYDKPVPPTEAVQLFDSFLTALADGNTRVFLIGGNHDSAERLAFGARLLQNRGVYIAPVYDGGIEPVVLEDEWGETGIYLLPFLRPAMVRHAFPDREEPFPDYQTALQAAVERLHPDPVRRNVLVAHQFVTGASRCESEDISAGGLDNVDVSVFDGFDYVALGHLHTPQHVGRREVRYCGTPLKYSFSECGQEKSVTVAELKGKGETQIRTVPLKPLRDMRRIRGSYLEVTARSFHEKINPSDYLAVTLTDEEDILDGLQKLRVFYPNLMRLEYDNRRTRENRALEAVRDMERKSGQELFEEFYELQNNQPMSGEQKAFVKKLLEDQETGDGGDGR